MKILLLIFWAIGLAQCDKLDRTYLPPPRSVTAGGYHEDLNLPLDHPEQNYILMSDPNQDRTNVDSSITFKYPNIEVGINRQVPSMSASTETFTNRAEIPFPKNIYNVPSTIASYAFTQTTTELPVENYDRTVPMSTFSQEYSPKSSSFVPHLSKDHFLIPPITYPHTAQQAISIMSSDIVGINLSNENVGPIGSQISNPIPQTENFQQVPQKLLIGGNVEDYLLDQSDKVGGPKYEGANLDDITASNITPQSLPRTTFPIDQYGGDLDSISVVLMPNPDNDNQPNLKTYPSLKEGANEFHATDTNSLDSLKPGSSSTLKSKPTMAKTTISTIPTHVTPINNSNITYNKNVQPERIKTESDRNAVVINYENILTPDGFAYSFDTSNGIHADESGTAIDGVKAIGSYSFVGDDGKVYSVEYTADENGFLARGNHLPTAPPIPDAILRGIKQSKMKQQLGIVDDGSYDDAKYGHERYQGFMRRMPQYRFNNNIISKPGIKQNALKNKTDFLEGMQLPANERKYLEDISDVRGFDLMTNPPNQMKIVEAYNENPVPKLPDANQPNENQLFKSDEFEIIPKNKLRSDPINSNSKETQINKNLNENYDKNSDTMPTNPGVFIPMRQAVDSPKGYNADKMALFYRGYEYTQPQKIFKEYDGKSSQTHYSNTKEDVASNPDDKINYSSTTHKPFLTPNVSFNYKSQKPDFNTQILRTNFNDPFKTYGNINSSEKPRDYSDQSRASTFYNNESDKLNEGEIPNLNTKRVYSSFKPVFTSTTLAPDFYHSLDITTADGNRRINYPSSLGFKLFATTTPLPSRLTSSTDIVNYPQTTPITAYLTSTSRPLITSGRSGITPQRPGLRGSGSGQDIDAEFQEPKDFGRGVNERLGYQGISGKSFVPQDNSHVDFKPRFGLSSDPRSQIIKVTSTPENTGKSSSTATVIGEDFSGPKQLQKFDPERGYYY